MKGTLGIGDVTHNSDPKFPQSGSRVAAVDSCSGRPAVEEPIRSPASAAVPSGWFGSWSSIFKNVISALAGAAAALGAVTLVLQKVPETVTASKIAYTSVIGMWISTAPPGTSPQGTATQGTVISERIVEVSRDTVLGPAPHPGCEVFVSTDFSVMPPKITRSWRC